MSKPSETGPRRTYGSRQNETPGRMERPVGAFSRIGKLDLPEPGNRTGAGAYARSTVAGWNRSWGTD